ncbi:uncharacterized protein At3g43530-like [Eutrema salsugineum]|uniref:uncharacterized protein At3g43530-like n=1 Tax=Eutrema salsugineum TaxID=72664 RepID=UPI000CECF57C|nr:uncharacterized protein At3g43530-like [Eutrema salsugineum]
MTSFGGDSESLQLTLWEPLRFCSEVEEQTRNEQTRNEQTRNEQTRNEQTRNDEENQPPMQPLSMYFSPNQYNKAIKLGTQCWIHKAVKNLESPSLGLRPEELRWFSEHLQFKHFWHMHKAMYLDTTHKTQGLWMLLLYTAKTNKRRECWFVVNGVPIRYSLKEHALISGLDCHDCPKNYEKMGSSVLRRTSVLGGKAKTGKGAPSVDPLFLRMVEDLDACRTFPWGKYSFDANLKEIEHTLRHFNGVVETDSWTFPGFVIPLELLPFEAVPCLKDTYREKAKGADIECPQMCKTKFRPFTLKGFPLSDLYETLGNTKDIQSILEPSADEEDMLAGIMERYEDPDNNDTIPDTWTSRIIDDGKPIFWKDMSLEDVKNRVEPAKNASSKSPAPSGIVDQIQGLKKSMDEQFQLMRDQINDMDIRLKSVESYVKEAIRSECLGEEKEGEEQGDEGEEQVGGEVAKKEKKKTKTKAAVVRKYLTRQLSGIQEQSGVSVEEGEVQHEKKKKKSRN